MMFNYVIKVTDGRSGENDLPITIENFKRAYNVNQSELTIDFLAGMGYAPVNNMSIPQSTFRTTVVARGYVVDESGYANASFEVFDKTVEEMDRAFVEDFERNARNDILKSYDWYAIRAQMGGDPVPAEVAAYCQALRDITNQDGWPFSIVWPAEPGSAATSSEKP